MSMTVAALVEEVVRWASAPPADATLARARQVFEERTAPIDPEGRDHESRIAHFLDWFIVDYTEDGAGPAVSRYAEAHPDRCLGLSLTSMWLARAQDIDWWFQGVRTMFPELWDAFASLIPPEERGNVREAYCRRILGEDAEVAATAAEQLYTYE